MRWFLLALLLLIPGVADAAIPAGAHWEVRITGNADNGGFYDIANDGGTDYSNFDDPELTLTDLATTGAVTTLTSATGGFTSAMVDNGIQIKSGTNFDAGFYEITAYTDTYTVTLDRTPSSGGAGSGGTGSVGGAITSINTAVDNVPANGQNIVYVKYSATAYTEEVSFGTYGNYHLLTGYNTTRGDNPTGADRPVIDGEDTRTNCIVSGGNEGWVIMNLICKQGTGAGVSLSGGVAYHGFSVINVRSHDNGTYGFYNSYDIGYAKCEADANGSTGIYADASASVLLSYSHDNTGAGITNNYAERVYVYGCVAEGNGGVGIEVGQRDRTPAFVVSSIAEDNSSAGIQFSDANKMSGCFSFHNITKDNGTYGLAASDFTFVDYTITHNDTTDHFLNIGANEQGDNNSTTDPDFTNANIGNFTVSDTSPALDAGFDFTDIGMVGSYLWNIGIDQDDNAAGEGGGGGSYTFVE